MALNGAAAHAFTHIIYKGLLLMSAGSVLYATGRRKCSELGGLFHSMPLTTICGSIGALAISSFPLTSGFVSKSMVAQAAADEGLLAVWLLLARAAPSSTRHLRPRWRHGAMRDPRQVADSAAGRAAAT